MSRLASKLIVLDRIIADLKANAPADPFAHLSAREREAVERYRRTADPITRYAAAVNGDDFVQSAGLLADYNDQQTYDAWQSELDATAKWYRRREALKVFRK